MTDEVQMLRDFTKWMDFYSPGWMQHFTPGEVEPMRKCWFAATEKAQRPEVDALLADEINKAFIASCAGHGEPVQDVSTLTKRVRLVASSLECAQTNFRVTNDAYCKLDQATRALRSPQKATDLRGKYKDQLSPVDEFLADKDKR